MIAPKRFFTRGENTSSPLPIINTSQIFHRIYSGEHFSVDEIRFRWVGWPREREQTFERFKWVEIKIGLCREIADRTKGVGNILKAITVTNGLKEGNIIRPLKSTIAERSREVTVLSREEIRWKNIMKRVWVCNERFRSFTVHSCALGPVGKMIRQPC